jgi:hypothetical protein
MIAKAFTFTITKIYWGRIAIAFAVVVVLVVLYLVLTNNRD